MNRVLIGYLVVALLTFGYSYNADWRPGNDFARAEEINSIGAFMAAMVWPLYWTAKAFSPLRQSGNAQGHGS